MKNTTWLIPISILALGGAAISGCTQGSTAGATVSEAMSMPSKGNFRLSLTDAPHPSLSHVIVNVDHIELMLEKGDRQGRLILAQGLGPVDLLKLRDGVHLPIRDLHLQEDVVVKQFRLILKDNGNWIERLADDSICNLKTPSQQQTGLKLILPDGGVSIEKDSIYSLIVDFDVDHSIVDNSHVCLLKPVLKVKDLVKVPVNDDTNTDSDSDDSVNDNDSPPIDDGTSTSTTTTTTTTTTTVTTTTTTTVPSNGDTTNGSDTVTNNGSDSSSDPVVISEGDPDFFVLD
jgi:hypothetical protein